MMQGICQNEVPTSVVFASQSLNSEEYPQTQKSSWSAASLQMSALELCYLILSSSVATSFPLLMSVGASTAAFGVTNG